MLARIKPIIVLVNIMLDGLPAHVWTSTTTTFLDPAMGSGQFLIEVIRRLREAGHSDENIRSRVYGFEYNKALINLAVNMNKLIGNFSKMSYNDYLNQGDTMKFDVIVGNPPYEEGGRKDQANKLWPLFVKQANELITDGGYVAMVTPNNWMQPTADIGKGSGKNAISIFTHIFKKNNLIMANVDSEHLQRTYFNGIGSTFSYFVYQKAPYSGNTQFITPQGTVNIDISNVDVLPKFLSVLSIGIMKKMVGEPFTFIDQNHNLNGHEQSEKDATHKYRIYHTNKDDGTYWYSENKSPYANNHKVILTLSGRYNPVLNSADGFSNMCMAVVCNDANEADAIYSILNSKLYKFWVEMQKFSGFVPRKIVLQLPAIDTSKVWNDNEIYNHFGITADEVDYIESNIK
jgi:site-specific DNA-methyltransferase (adenine-specific)